MRTKEVILKDFKKAKTYKGKLSGDDQTEILFLEVYLDRRDELKGIREELKHIANIICKRGA